MRWRNGKEVPSTLRNEADSRLIREKVVTGSGLGILEAVYSQPTLKGHDAQLQMERQTYMSDLSVTLVK